MAKTCMVTGRRKRVGNNVSHSKRRTKRVQEVNLHWKRLWDETNKKWVKLRVSAKAIKTIGKKGLVKVLKKSAL